MRHWNYLQASFPPDDLDEASGILWGLGTNGIEEDPLRSGRLRIKAYFDPLQDLQSLAPRIQDTMPRRWNRAVPMHRSNPD